MISTVYRLPQCNATTRGSDACGSSEAPSQRKTKTFRGKQTHGGNRKLKTFRGIWHLAWNSVDRASELCIYRRRLEFELRYLSLNFPITNNLGAWFWSFDVLTPRGTMNKWISSVWSTKHANLAQMAPFDWMYSQIVPLDINTPNFLPPAKKVSLLSSMTRCLRKY